MWLRSGAEPILLEEVDGKSVPASISFRDDGASSLKVKHSLAPHFAGKANALDPSRVRNVRVAHQVVCVMPDWNKQIIEEFRANDGKVGGNFVGAPIVLVHHRGRKSGREYITPMMYLADEQLDTIYVFASKAGAPTNPDWYRNLVAAGRGEVEVGVETYAVRVRDLAGEERDRIYAEQTRRYPGFAGYAAKTAGIRTIPVLALDRA